MATPPIEERIYTVESGDALWKLATKFQTTTELITQMNPNVDLSILYIGQKIHVPLIFNLYTVQAGENIASIAVKFKTTKHVIWRNNFTIEPSSYKEGMEVYVPLVVETEYPLEEITVSLPPNPEEPPEEEPTYEEPPALPPSEYVEDSREYSQSMLFVLDRTQRKVSVLNNDIPFGQSYTNDIFTEALQSNLSTLEFEVQVNKDIENFLEVEGYIIYTKATNHQQILFTIKEIEDVHSDTLTKRVFCEHASISDLNSVIVRPTNMISVTLEQALGIVLNQTGYVIGDIEFSGLRDINIETHMTALEALHLVVSYFGELEFEIVFNNTQIKRKQVNVVQKRGRDTGKVFEYGRNMTEISRRIVSNEVVTALIGVGKTKDNVPLTFLNYTPATNNDYPKVDDYIYSVSAYQNFNKQGKQVFGVFFDDESTNAVQLYERTLEHLKEVSVPKISYECSVVNFEQITGLSFYAVEVGDTVTIKDFEFAKDEPLLLNGRVIEKKVSITDPSKSSVKLGNFTIAQINENQGRILKQFQKVIMLKEAEWDSANAKAEQAIADATEAYELAEVADTNATEAKTQAGQAITDVANKLDKDIYTQEQNAIVASIAEKAGLEYVDGILADKANIADTVTKTTFEEAMLGKVGVLEYETDQTGLVTRLESAESRITQNEQGFELTVSRDEFQNIQIGAKNYVRNGDFRSNSFNYYTTSGNPTIVDVADLAGFSKGMRVFSTVNSYQGVQVLNFINSPNDLLNKKIIVSFYSKFQNVVIGINSWEKLNGGMYYLAKFADGTQSWVYPTLPLSTVGTDMTWNRYTQKVILGGLYNGKEITEILDIRMKFWLENCVGEAFFTGIMLEISDFVTDFSPHPEDGQQIAIDQANSQFIQQADLIATKVEQNGVISAINQTAEMIEIDAQRINLSGAVTADSIASLNGLDVGNGQFKVSATGDVSFGGTLNGANGTFNGLLETTNDLKIGDNIYMNYEYNNRFNSKGIIFYDGIAENSTQDTRIVGTYLTLDITCNNRIRMYTDLLDINSQKIWIDGEMQFSGAEFTRTSGTEKGFCGIGAVSPTTTNNANIAGVAVNFRVKKTYIPSSVTLTATSWTTEPNYTNITTDGFWLYVKTTPTGTIFVGGYYYWRGYYEC